jgi:drug/metabolite transporter (DMT)-like permease
MHLINIKNTTKKFFPTRQVHIQIIKLGILSAINGFMIVYSSSDSRTPVDLQGIFTQLIIPFSFLFSKYIKKESMTQKQMYGAVVVIFGICTSFIPMIMSFFEKTSNYSSQNIIWCGIRICGIIVSAYMFVLQDKTFKQHQGEFTRQQMLAFMVFYQLVVVILMFYIDFIPWFGSTSNINDWMTSLKNGIICVFTCNYAWITACAFIIAYMTSYSTNAFILQHVSANYKMIVGSIVSPLSISFWLIFPSLNSIILSGLTISIDYISVVIILIGTYIFVKGITKK